MDKSPERDAPAPAETPAPARKKLAIPKPAVIAAVVVALIAGSYFLQKTLLFSDSPLAAQATVVHSESEAKEAENDADADGESEVIMLDEIVINPAETGGRRYLSVTMGLQLPAGEESKTLIDKNTALLRDTLITLLSAKHLDQLADPAQRDSLKQEIKEAVNKRLKGAPVRSVVFSGYVLQ